jgi:hypothetical protein
MSAMNTKDFRIAFCTDFSETSNKRLNTFLFNIWSFNVSVDIIHIIENEEESFREIEELKAGLSLQESHFGSFNFVIFNKNEKEELLAHLNSGI